MIYGKLTDAPSYRGIHPRLDRVLELLDGEFLAALGTERRELEGEALFVTRFDVESVTDEKRLYERHERYLDVFTLVRGCERVDLAASAAMELREHSGDYWGGVCAAEQSVVLTPGSFLVLFPGDAHRPGMAVGEPEALSRVVFKILL
jgi:YhcH/YjgK/YiaL family protein